MPNEVIEELSEEGLHSRTVTRLEEDLSRAGTAVGAIGLLTREELEGKSEEMAAVLVENEEEEKRKADVEERLRLQGVEEAGDLTIIDEQTIIVNGKKKKKKKRKKKKKGDVTIINETINEDIIDIGEPVEEKSEPPSIAMDTSKPRR